MKMIINVISTNLVTNSFMSLFYPFVETKTRLKFSASWCSGNDKYFFFFVYSESHSTSKVFRS